MHGRNREALADRATGFVASARVVVAAAVIMFSVFAAFVPEGEGPIKTIAFGLAVGVFVDAFLVRMTLVPAVLALLGRVRPGGFRDGSTAGCRPSTSRERR